MHFVFFALLSVFLKSDSLSHAEHLSYCMNKKRRSNTQEQGRIGYCTVLYCTAELVRRASEASTTEKQTKEYNSFIWKGIFEFNSN